ncbi:amidase [Herbaspirillum sp. GCM10030257]|uniref:amidase n=1 Tax=Herbaspirillum sp. GCM10030257 TaxID=3273393 RepID=UPI003616979F
MNATSTLPALVALTASQLSLAIRSREVSCRDVMTAYLPWIEKINPAVNAIVSLQDAEYLLRQADECDNLLARGEYLGWMHGFPQAPKDLAATDGIITTLGSPLMKKHVPRYDAIVVERAKRSGAILIGKTNTPELGLGSHTYNSVFGTTLNAYDQRRTAGGSSGGAAVAVALHMLPVADGSDMMGSLRNPAAYNNIFGFRPSFGRVPNGPGNEVFYQQLSTEGPMARTVTDLAMLLSVQAGYDARAPLSLATDPAVFAGSLQRDFKGTRIGWLGDMDGYLPMEDGILNLCGSALTYFEDLGVNIERLGPGFDMDRVWSAWLALRGFLIAGKFGMMATNPATRRMLKPEALWEIEQGQKLSAADVYRASTERSAWYEAVRKLFEQVDFLVLPTAQVFPFDATLDWPKQIAGKQMDTYHRWMEVVVPATLAGLPAISVPAGFNDAGLPIGLQIIGKPQDDLSVLQLAYAYEQVIPYTQIKPRLLA